MLGHMMAVLNRRILKSYVRLGERWGHWSSLDQKYIDIHGETGRRVITDWPTSTEEYENEG